MRLTVLKDPENGTGQRIGENQDEVTPATNIAAGVGLLEKGEGLADKGRASAFLVPYATGATGKRTWHRINSDRLRDQGKNQDWMVISITEDQSQLHRDLKGEELETESRKSQEGKEIATKSSPYRIVEKVDS